MTAPAARHDNGLLATDYVRVARPLADVAEPLLDALRRTRIAAFVVSGPADGRCELWVDAVELDDVRIVLAAVARHTDSAATDIALIGETDADEAPLPSLSEGWQSTNPTPSAAPYPTPVRPVRPSPGSGPGSGPVERPRPPQPAPDPLDDPADHFEPDEPEPLPRLSRTTRWAMVILGAGTACLIASGLLVTVVGAYDGLLSLLGTAGVLVGAGMLVTRLRDGRRDDGQGNDGGPNGDGAVL